MTSGLAHEIRSTMTCLLSGAELLQLQAKEKKHRDIFKDNNQNSIPINIIDTINA